MSMKSKGEAQSTTQRWNLFLCIVCFSSGIFFTNWMWITPGSKSITRITATGAEKLELVSEGWEQTSLRQKDVNRGPKQLIRYITKPHQTMPMLNEKISDFERKLVGVRSAHISSFNDTSMPNDKTMTAKSSVRKRYLMVVGINTAFSSRQRRDSVRDTWMPHGGKRKKLEEDKGIIMRFVIGHSSTAGGALDKAIDAENKRHGDIMRLDHVEGYLELSAKTKAYFTAAVSMWDADFYVKVDDDVHVNIATLGETLVRHRDKPRVYIGCMKSGPVLAQKGVRYHEPEYWKFGELGNKYFLHATGQLYAISKDLANYISVNQNVLHEYANEDVSLGSWFIGLDVHHIDDRRICCATSPDCERKARAGNACIASFDWGCSGICRPVERMRMVHKRCAENHGAVWKASF